jgi:hypothetical protein
MDSQESVPSPKESITIHSPSSAGDVGGIVAFRNELLQKHYRGATSLMSRLKEDGGDDLDSLIICMIKEMISESDNLLGNELIATNEGNLRAATSTSARRVDVLEKILKAAQAKREFERGSGIDVDSPSVIAIFRFFLSKVKSTFDGIGMDKEQADLFFRSFDQHTINWKRELKELFASMAAR